MERVKDKRDYFVQSVIKTIESFPDDQFIRGMARFTDDHTLRIDDELEIKAERIVIATGSHPTILPMLKSAGDRLITSDDIFYFDDLPESIAVIGAGVIGLELGQALHRLGVRVHILDAKDTVGLLSDPATCNIAQDYFCTQMPLTLGANIESANDIGDAVELSYTYDGKQQVERFEYILSAIGRTPNLKNLGLENTSLCLTDRGIPTTNPLTMQTSCKHIFLAGDVNGEFPILHEAAFEGDIAGNNAGRFPDIRAQYRRTGLTIIFTDPQIMRVGQSFQELNEKYDHFAKGEVSFEDQGRSNVMRVNAGLLRVYGDYASGRLLGAEMIGPAAEHIAHLLCWCIEQNMRVADICDMPFYHPTIEEGVRTALRQLSRNLQTGPEPETPALECGPGS
jgi:dihydrolipoamide dehydrogenase